jgi:branched-chain amino acid aminotransferase
MPSIVWLNGTWIDQNKALVPVDDRSLRLGDGIFDTIRVHKGKLIHSNAHLDRLAKGLVFFKLDYDISQLEHHCHALIAKNMLMEGFVRIIIRRGNGQGSVVGYRPPEHTVSSCVITSFASPLLPPTPVRLAVSSVPLAWRVPCKILSALPYIAAMQEAIGQGCDNALMLTYDGLVCEASNANIFWIQGETLYAPAPDLPFIPGTVAALVPEVWTGIVKHGHFTLKAFKDADEIFLANVGGILTPVQEIKGVTPVRNTFAQALFLRAAVLARLGISG